MNWLRSTLLFVLVGILLGLAQLTSQTRIKHLEQEVQSLRECTAALAAAGDVTTEILTTQTRINDDLLRAVDAHNKLLTSRQ